MSLAETVLSLFAPNKQPVIISLAIKLNHIPGKGNVAVLCFFFLSGRGGCIFENQTYNYYWRHDHYTSLTREAYVLFDEDSYNFSWSRDLCPVHRKSKYLPSNSFGDTNSDVPSLLWCLSPLNIPREGALTCC